MIEKKNNKKIGIISCICILIIILIAFGFIYLNNSKKLTELEEIKITEISDLYSNYLEYIDGSKDNGDYILFALEYNYEKNDDKDLSLNESIKFLNSVFNKDFKRKDLEKIGLTPKMVDKNINYDNEIYQLSSLKKSSADIMATKIVKYNITDIKKTETNKYSVTYDKYVIKDLSKILNYYSDKNDIDAVKEITKCLKGEEKIGNIKKYITSKNQNKVGKKEKQITVDYVVKNKKVFIDKIK